MRMFLVSDNIDTQIGMRIAGVEGVVVHTPEELKSVVKMLLNDQDLAILLFTEKAAELDKEFVSELKLTLHKPLIAEIPDRHGRRDIGDSINNMVSESIGLKL